MSEKKKLSRAEQIERFVKANAVTQDKGVLGHAQDAGLSLLSGAVSVPETAVGLADILSGGTAGKFLENQDGVVGFRPKETKEAIASWKTERGQKQLQDFQEAEGIGAKFGQAVRNPTLVTNTVLESLPAMGAGGVVGRGLGVAAKGISPVVAGAVGEGVVGAGMAAEAIRQQTDDGLLTPKQAGLAAATGVTTAGFGYGGGKVAQKLGLGDVDTMIVGGTRNASGRAGAEGAQEATNKGLVRRTLEAAATEGFLEELPQSVSEQVLQNIALENDIMDGVDEAAVLGVLSGGLMGGIAGAGTRRQAPIDNTPPPPPPTTDVSVRDEPPQGPAGPTEPAGIDNLNRNFYDQGRGPDNQGMRDVTPTAEPKDVPTDPLSAAANTAQNTDIPQLGFYGDRARDTAATDNAQVEPTPAEKMGLDETQGGLTAAAAKAVNSGASAAATQLTDENPTVNIPAPRDVTPNSNATEQNNNNNNNELQNSLTRANEPAQQSGADNDRMAANTAIATGKDGSAKWFGREEKAQEFVAKKNISDTHEVVSAGKSRFEIQPKAQTTGPTAETSAVQNQTSAPKRSEARNTPVKDEAKSIGKAYTADNDEVPYQWDVVDAKDLVSSHTNTFGKNPDFPADAQPRDRANAGYQAQVLDIINRFNPEFLGESALASAGSPIIGSKDNVVESGNGRTIAIRTKYENGSGEAYRQFVNEQAAKFGLDTETVASMSEPVLVRRNLSDMDRGEFAVRANKDDKASMGSTEIARIDAKAIPNTDLIEFDKNGSMNLNASRKFTQAFTKAVGTNEAGNLIDKDGNISQTGKLRITGALLHNAYNSDKLTRAVTETIDPSAQNVLKVLTDKAPQINKIKQHVESGKRTSSTLAEDIKTAAEKYIDLVESGANIDLFLANNDLFSEDAISEQAAEIIGDFYDNPRSAVKIGQAIQVRIDADTQANDPNAAGLFGAEDAPAVQTPNNKKRSILRSKNKPQEVSDNEQPAESKQPKTLGAGKEKRTFIGKNAAGEMIYEDGNGIRSKRRGEFMASEPVKIQLGNDEKPFDTSNRPDDFKLERELAPTQIDAAIISERESDLASKGVAADPQSDVLSADNRTVRQISLSYESKESRLAALNNKLRNITEAAKNAGVKISTSANYYQEAFNDSEKAGSKNPNKSYVSGRQANASAYNLAHAEVMGAIKFVENDNVAQRKAIDADRSAKASETKSIIEERNRAAEAKKQAVSNTEELVESVFGMSMDDIYKAVFKDFKRLEAKAKRTGNQDDQAAANKAKRKARQDVGDIEDAVTDFAKGDINLDQLLSSKAGSIPEISEAVTENTEAIEDTPAAGNTSKITGQEGWQGNLVKSRQLARQLYEAGYMTGVEIDMAFADEANEMERSIENGLYRQAQANNSTEAKPQPNVGKSETKASAQVIEDAEVIEDTPAKEKEIKDRFANNTFFDSDTVAAARARIKSKMGRVNSGIDPEMLTDGAILAGAYIESGVRKFSEYAKIMIDDLGKNITPYLLTFWNGARDYPGFDSTGMTNEVDSRAQFNQLMLEYKPSKEMDAVLGEDKTQVKPKRKVTKPTNKDVMLRQDWGVKHIDGYVESDEFKGEQTDYGVSGGVKDAFLKDAKNYLTATKKHLESLGYTMALDRKGKPHKINVNAAGPAVSGDVSLSMYKDGSNIHVSIGQSSVPMMSMFRDTNADGTPVNNAPHPQQVAVMYRTSMNDGDTYATKHNNSSGNIWVSHKLTATELAADIDKTSNAVAARAAKTKLKDADYGVANIDERSDADEIIAALMEKEDDDTAASNDRDQESGTGELSAASGRDGAQRRAGPVRADSVADVGAVDRSGPARDTSDNNKGQSVREAERSNDDGVGSQQGGDGSSNAASTRSTKPRSNLTNHRLQADDLQRKGSWFNAAENNVAVIELIQKITNEDRAATAQEKQQLALYTGWGASEIANGIFPNPTTGEYKTPRWQELGEKLKDLLTPTDYATARQTTQYAHYTPPVVVEGIYKALDRFGFAGGQVLEPASGVGVFNGLMPDNMAKNSTYTGIELDPTTGRIAQLLYPQSRMLIDDYTETKLPDNHFDVAVGNPPFANISYDYGKGKDKQSFQLHDYFFVKTMDKVKPGGIVVFVTSTGTMDKKTDGARKWLSERADLIGAVRLPQTAFKENSGTETVTDIIFLRKRKEGEQPSDVEWSGVKTVDINGEQLSINEYYANNPDMVVGKAGHKTNQFGKVVYNVTEADGDFGENLQAALDKMPANIFSVERGSKQEAAKVAEMDFGARSAENKEGGVYIKDGILMRVQNGIGAPLTTRMTQKGTETPLTDKQKAFLTDYVPLREALKQAQRDQLDDNPNWEASLANLNKVYDAFVKKHGPILKHSISEREVTEIEYDDDGAVVDTVTTVRVQKTFANSTALFLDAESSLVRGIENIVEGKTSKDGKQGVIEKGDFFKGRTLNKPKRPTINSTQDALEASLNETGSLDVARVAELVGKTQKEVIEDLGDQAYFDPKTQTHMLAEDYLSGNVVEKLELARESLRSNPNLQRNISALEAVQPEPILAKDISANLGSVWVPTETIQQFATEVLGVKRAEVKHLKLNNTWTVDGYGGNLEYSSGARKTTELLAALLGSKQIVVKTKMSDGTSVLNEVATQEANDAADKIKEAWKNWVWEDNDRAATLSEIYNRLFNNIVPAFYGNGEHLTLDGMSSLIKLRPHQKRGIYRVIRQGDIYLNHAVGAGKTFTMIASAMEEKRLGLINKPMFVVPNHMLDQFSQEFLMLYPAANIMVADTANFHTSNRRNFIAQAAVNSPDAIIITHSSFGKIGVSNKLRAEYLQQEVDNYAAAIQEAIENGQAKDRSVKQMESAMQTIQNRIGKLLDPKNKDNNANFEDMGVDRLYVDEMHEFRKLSFPTKQGRVKGITSLGSQKAMDLKMKVGILRDKGATRAIVGASGTPITNTMGELFTVQRFFDPNQLEKDGLSFFDSWAAQFGETVEGLEQSASGGYAMVKRFAKFQNMPELMSRVRSFMDVLTNYDLGSLVQRPEVHGGSRKVIVTPTPDGFVEYQQELADRIEAIKKRGGKPQKGEDIILKVITDGRFAALDMRFVDSSRPSDPNSKLNYAIEALATTYKETADLRYTTDGIEDELPGSSIVMFSDIGLGEDSAEARGFDMKAWINSELIRLGVDRNHIAFISDYKSHAKKGVLFEDMRQGKKRILIGGKGMETGMNIQKRLSHLYHLDAPWFPASVEQREGRIIRQGNQNAEVFIAAFATKGSYDSTMWTLVGTKARFIEQAWHGDSSMRSMDDVSEASSFEQAAALSSGDQRYVTLALLRQKHEQLERASTAYHQRKNREQKELKQLNNRLVRAEQELLDTKAALKGYVKLEAETFNAKIGSSAFDSTVKFGEQLAIEYIKLNNDEFVGDKTVATVGGYPVVYSGTDGKRGYISEMNVDVPSYDSTPLITDQTIDDVRTTGLASRIMNRVNNMVSYVPTLEKEIADIKVRLPLLEKAIDRPFDKQAEKNQVTIELAELTYELESEAESAPDNDDQKFSRTGPVKGSTKTTPKQVIDKLASKFGKSVIDKLIANGTLEIKTLNDYVVDGELVIPSDVDGIYHQGKAILIADNLSDDMIIPTFLHELGGHGGLQTLMDKKAYDALMRDFDALVKAGDPMAMQAKAMADSVARNKQDALDEYLPYLITLASRAKAKQGKIAGMINRIAMAIRSWLRNTLGMSVKMNAQDVLALAERMVEARTQQPLNNIQSPINSFEGVKAPADQINAVREKQSQELRKAPNGKPSNLTEQQWLQVRTPAFKQWFGDWENDPANASKILDENGEPLVLYHGSKSDFWVFDMSRSVPQRNEGMMGMFFTDNAKTAAGYTVDLRKEAAVIKAKENLSKINNEFSFKRRQLETENKTGDQIQELTKKEFEAMKAAELKLKATIADAFNNAYDNAESRTKAVFVKSQMPFEQDADGKSFLDVNKKAAERYFVDGVYDGIVNNNVLDDANANHSVGAAKVVISFDATNIKSATDNMGAFDSSNPDIRLSRKRYTNENQLGFDFDEPMSAVAPANQPNLANTLADPKAKQEWREKNKVNQRQVRTPSVQEAAIQYQEGEITQDEYIKIVRKDMPIKPMGKVPKIPTLLDIGFALDTNKVETGIVGIDKSIENDTRVGLRLDIPAYDAYDTWVVSIHDGTKAGGKSLAYAQTGYISNVEFMTAPKGALNIATGKSNKSTIARMHGDWINHSPVALAEMAEKALASNDWIEVGMNPFRHSWFYDKADGNPVVSADEVIQIGALVLARNAQKTTVDDDQFTAGKGSGMKFSRAAGMNDQFDPRNIAKETAARFHDWGSSAPPGKLSWWHKTVGTMYNLAQRNKFFKPVFDHTEKFINDVSFYAAKASEFAPKLLPKLDGLKDITKTAIGAKDNDAISKPIFEGTLLWGRDLNGKAVLIDDWRKKVMATSKQDRLNMLRAANRITPAQEAELAQLNGMQENRFINGIIDDEVSAGLVWTDSELRSKFNLSDEQIKLYREFRAATDNSLDSLTRSDMLRKLGKDANDIEKLVMDASSLRRALFEVEQHINNLSTATPSKAQAYAKTLADIKTSVARTNKLIADGYAPLSRFGQYTVDVVDAAGNREYFGMFESAYDARKMAKEMADLYGADFVTQGALSSEEFKMFAGVTPETAELFGEMLGLEATGDNAADQAFQEFLRRTKNNRSAMKRLMHRKGIKGYSEDVGRVLASFIYSNARHTSAALNMGNLDRSIQDIPKAEGQLKDAAVKLAQYIKNPQEEGHVIRGFMFAQYLGGSIASAMVNLTQPIAVSFPYLSQFGGARKAAAELSRAAADWASKKTFSADLQKAIDEAEADGTLSPQEVHNLLRQAQGKNPLRAGDGTKYGDAKAAIQNTGSRIGLGWGAFFSLAEQINRRVTFVAAYRMAQDQGMANPAEFASRSIKETQFVYNKASRMQWGRGAVGGTLMTFKTYSVSYIELMHRLWTQGEKGSAERAAGRKAAMIMMATLFLLGGGGGLPFMEDIEDVIDGASQVLGYNLSTRKAREEFLDSVFGEMLGDFMESGISGIPGMPTDVSGRLGMDNLIPGTGVFKQRTSNTKDVLELAGPAGDFVSRVGTGTRSILKGAVSGDARQVGRGVLELSPVAVRNAAMGAGMLASGTYKDTKGYKVDDVTPIDAAFKALGFQPKEISKIQGQAWLSQTTTAYYNLRASEIRALWAAGISEGNKSKIADAQKALADWNKKNPSQIIVIRPTDIQRRVREMNMNKSDRVTKLAPKTMRAQIQDDFANARGEY